VNYDEKAIKKGNKEGKKDRRDDILLFSILFEDNKLSESSMF
jgi:hypothetical protein